MLPSKTLLQVFITTTPGRRNLPISSKFLENLFFPSSEREDYNSENITKIKLARVLVTSFEREDYNYENMTKIKLARVLVTSFDKSHHLEPSHFWFLFCCAII